MVISDFQIGYLKVALRLFSLQKRSALHQGSETAMIANCCPQLMGEHN
jgi:hypothetical protein